MSDIRNFEEYRRQVLDSLGEDYTVEDLRNEGKWRARVLDALGVDYDTSDTSYFERYRLKVLEGLQGGGGGGGTSDFSIATLTFTNGTGIVNGALAVDDGSNFAGRNGTTYKVILYKGRAYVSFPKVVESTTGNIEFVEATVWLVTGDCTVTTS